jgi:DNA adenine methylase
MSERKVFVPPLKIQGIKTKLVEWILKQIDFEIKGRWVEPFMGSGVVGFNARPKRAIFADKNPHIINFYSALKRKEITSQRVEIFLKTEGEKLAKKGEEYYYEVRERFNRFKDPLDFLFLNRACFNGVIRFNSKGEFNTPFGKKPNRLCGWQGNKQKANSGSPNNELHAKGRVRPFRNISPPLPV